MHHPVPRPQPLPPSVAPSAEHAPFTSPSLAAVAPFLTPSLATVVSGARRRALRDGDRQIDTAHLLHSLVESDPEVGAAFESGHQLARVLGYLVQRSIGYGLRWQRAEEGAAARRLLPAARGAESPGARPSPWSPAAAAALERAFRRAAERGEPQARGVDLLVALTADPESRAVEVLRRAGVDPTAPAARIAASEEEPSQQV